MANFAQSDTGREQAEALVTTRFNSQTWCDGHEAQDKDGNVIVRFQRFMSPSHPDYGAWVESRDTAIS